MEKIETLFYEKLKKNGYKLTTQRKVVFEILTKHIEEHLTVEEIYNYIKKDHPELGLATVYRNVQLLNDIGLVETLNLDDGFIRYQLSLESKGHMHHHLICEQCGKVIEVKEDLMESIEDDFLENYGFIVHNHKAKFYGICKECQAELDK